MENGAHTLSGLVLARLGIDRHGPWATGLVVTAANFPDIDAVSLFFGKAAYLDWHHGITHSVLGILVSGPLLAWLFHRFATRRGHDVQLSTFLWIAYAGLAMHCFLDSLISYGMRPWLPFDDTWYYGDVVHVADPYVWVILGAGAMLGGPRRRGVTAWGIFGFATCVAAFVAARMGRTEVDVSVGLLLCWVTLLTLRVRGIGEPYRRRFAGGALFGLAVYLVVLGFWGASNRERVLTQVGWHTRFYGGTSGPYVVCTVPRPCLPWKHRVLLRVDESHVSYIRYSANALGGMLDGDLDQQRLSVPHVTTLAGTREYECWKRFARLPYALETKTHWILGDARYGWEPRESWCNFRVDKQ